MTNSPLPISQAIVIAPQANMAALVVSMLRVLGCQKVKSVDSVSQAQILLDRTAFDLIVLDDGYARPDALDVVRHVRAQQEGLNRQVPIIMMAGAPDAARITAARDAGVTEFLRKPFAANHLKARIDSITTSPRGFVEGKAYSGPDRRRRNLAVGNAERRSS
ncbi:MAG: response regulator [Devosia sp.]|uniref:response regulator n=1 Tax=Devosia sp. TaxID=1871048 RepID=UPI0024CACDD3|nr:response regulator [Devosia sp.]UYN98264.1 MAG: response regulator [Devosia sp.]